MKTIIIITLIVIIISSIICFSCNSSNDNNNKEDNSSPDLSEKLDEYFSTLTKLQKFNGGVLIQKEGKRILYKAYNMEEDVNHSLHVSTKSQFDIHSISKLMAKACIVKLESQSLINRVDKISKYLPDFPNGESISIQNLLDNQSGLPRRLSEKHDDLIEKTPSELVDLIKKEDLLFEPGTDALYSNLGYQLIYFIISEVVQKPFMEYVDETFFKPLGMANSGAHFFLDKENLKFKVNNHINEDEEIISIPNFEKSAKNQARIYSTLDDLLKFIDYVTEEPYLSPLANKSNEIGWSGGGDGILSHAKASLNSKYELVFFSNYDEIPFGEILDIVEKIMTNQPYDLPKEINRQPVKLDRKIMELYIGKYDMAEFNHDEFEIRIEQDSFVFYQNGERNAVLQAENDSTLFYDPKAEDCFVFRKGINGAYKMIFFHKGIEMEGLKK